MVRAIFFSDMVIIANVNLMDRLTAERSLLGIMVTVVAELFFALNLLTFVPGVSNRSEGALKQWLALMGVVFGTLAMIHDVLIGIHLRHHTFHIFEQIFEPVNAFYAHIDPIVLMPVFLLLGSFAISITLFYRFVVKPYPS